jgi:hypothetical protein
VEPVRTRHFADWELHKAQNENSIGTTATRAQILLNNGSRGRRQDFLRGFLYGFDLVSDHAGHEAALRCPVDRNNNFQGARAVRYRQGKGKKMFVCLGSILNRRLTASNLGTLTNHCGKEDSTSSGIEENTGRCD